MTIRAAYLDAATVAASLLADPAVAAAWERPSALAKLSVKGLAGHLARQVLRVPAVVAGGPLTDPPVTLLEHYTRSDWLTADLGATGAA